MLISLRPKNGPNYSQNAFHPYNERFNSLYRFLYRYITQLTVYEPLSQHFVRTNCGIIGLPIAEL